MENNQNMANRDQNGGMAMDQNKTSKHTRRKQKTILAAVFIICMTIVASGTLAFFTAEETAYNVITTGILSMELIEETTDGKPWPEDGIGGVVPGMEVDKIPYVKNNGGIDFWARMSISMKVVGADGKELSDEYISLNIDRANWTEKDGYFYYNHSVKPGEESKPLFTKVAFGAEMPNAYMNAKVEIEVHADAVQSKNNGNSALTASGWTEAE